MKVLYNGSCPICSKEIDHYKKHSTDIEYEDLETIVCFSAWGTNKEEAKRKVIHTSRFSDLAKDFIEEKKFEWRNTKHRKQWASTLETYAYKILDSKPIEDIEVQDVMRVLKPIWVKKTVTAQRVMQRIAKVMGKGKSLGLSLIHI